ncbi:MAG: helix-turn-helix transcriptional regulator [Eisenbergiella sp.]
MNNRIKKLRKELDLTQQKFGERIGVKGNTIAQYESGRNEPIDAVIALICREFGVNEEWLRNGAGEMFAPDPGNELDALASKYSLSAADQILIEKYVSLKPSARETIMNFITEVVAALDVHDNTYSDIPDSPEELESKYPTFDDCPDDRNRVG